MQSRIIIIVLLIIFKIEAQSSVLNICDSLIANGNYSKAIEKLKTYNDQNKVPYRLAKAYDAIGDYDDALLNYKKAVINNPNDALIKYELAKLLRKTKEYNEASVLFQKLITIDNTNANYQYNLGLVLERLQKETEAQEHFTEAYKIDAAHQKAIYKLAKYSLKKREFERLDTLITIGLDNYAKNAALISLKAQSMYEQHMYTKAIIWFEKVLELNEERQFIYEKLSLAYTKELEYKKAIENLKKALEYEPKNTDNLYRLGHLYHLIDDYENAEENIKLSLKLQDRPLDMEYNELASIYNQLKNPQEAVKQYKKALKENPNNEQTKFFLVFTKSSYYKDLQSRINLFETFIKNNPKSNYVHFAKRELSKLKTEQFMKDEDDKN